MPPSTPIPDSYWVVPDRLLAGQYPGSHDSKRARRQLAKFLDAGIRTFIDLTEDDELEPYDTWLSELARERGVECRHLRHAITDMDVPDGELLERILGVIDEELAAGRPVYVHCWGGVGRTGTVSVHRLLRVPGGQALQDTSSEYVFIAKRCSPLDDEGQM